MANPSWLEPYYDGDIRPMLEEGVSQVKIRETLKDKYGVEVPRSTLSDFLKSLQEGNGRIASRAAGEEGCEGRIEALTRELSMHIAGLIADRREADRASEARHETVTAILDSLRAERLEAASRFNLWVKASLYTGPFWAAAGALLWYWLVR